MSILITAISLAATLGLSACGILFFGSWIANDIHEMKHHAL